MVKAEKDRDSIHADGLFLDGSKDFLPLLRSYSLVRTVKDGTDPVINEDFVKSLFIQDESLSGSLAEHCKIYLDHLSDFVFKGHFRKRLFNGPLDVRRTHCAARTIAGRDSKDTGRE